MRENIAASSKLQLFERTVEGSSEELQGLSCIVTPAQIHHYVRTFEQYARTVIDTQFKLGIEIAEDLGPVPGDYISLLLDLLIECAKYMGSRIGASKSLQLRLSEVRRHAQFSHIVTEIQYRDPDGITGHGLSKEMSLLRRHTEEFGGAVFIDDTFHDRITLRVLLPIISLGY